ncbi:YdgA family protein [Alteromonas lipotrueae]|uniref:YdgA family protein n=1 Tax=Alteromonas lipotrueae TaxID=2803814 RepID=UPI001C451A2A|nr:YdgA family protein [Alteromonas lipotrueae]
MSKNTKLAVGVLVALGVCYVGGNVYASSKAKDAVDEMIAELPATTQVSYRDVSATIFGDVSIDDIRIGDDRQGHIVVKNIALSGFEEALENSTEGEVHFSGVSFSEYKGQGVDDTPDDIQEILVHMLMNEGKTLDQRFAFEVNEDDNEYRIKELTFDVEDAGRISLSTDLFTKAPISTAPELIAQHLMAAIEIGEFTLSLEEDGLVDRLFASQVTAEKSLDDLRDEAIDGLKNAMKQSEPQRKMLLEGTIALLEGGEVTLYRESDEPFSIVPMTIMSGPNGALATFIRDGKFQIEVD